MNPNRIESISADLFTGKVLENWPTCDLFISQWGKSKGFNVIKDRVHREGDVIRRRVYICEHGKNHESNSKKETSTKRTSCPWHINASSPKLNNPNSAVFINKIVDEHNHDLNIEAIVFEESKKFSDEMMEDIQFLTQHCKMGATAQRRYLEGKYPSHPIYSVDLYAAIKKFRPSAKSLSNDAAQMSDWLDKQKERDSRWVVARGWDDDNTLTHLLWMTPEQVENWIQFSDCVINDITHKTNRYGMALSLFVGFDRNRQNIIFAQGLLIDESKDSHIWLFRQIIEATNIHPTVILTDSDPAVDAAVKEIFPTTYPIHCAFHITQNLHKNLRKLLGNQYEKFLQDFYKCRNSLVQTTFHNRFMKLIEDYPSSKCYLEGLYKSKEYWAHSYTKFKFTGGMIATSRVESVNACVKRLLYNSNVSLCELMFEINRLLDEQDRKNQYNDWKLTIPSVKNLEHSNFLFMKVDKCCQDFLTTAILKIQRDEINQSLYYAANFVNQQDIITIDHEFPEDNCAENPLATINQLLEVVGHTNVKEIWAVKVGNSLTPKHYIILLKNDAHICSCLSIIQRGIICRHYFQVMLSTSEARFHIRLIPSRWYQKDKDASHEPFIVADKFHHDNAVNSLQNVTYLCAIDKEKNDFLEQRMNVLDQKKMYGTLHGVYKKALQKALQTRSGSLQLIEILEEFADEYEDEESDASVDNNKENAFELQNPKRRRGKGRPAGTRRYKASHEKDQSKVKQRRCRKCGNMGHYQKNCTSHE